MLLRIAKMLFSKTGPRREKARELSEKATIALALNSEAVVTHHEAVADVVSVLQETLSVVEKNRAAEHPT